MFNQIPIDVKNKTLLEKAITKNIMNHCYIFVGPEGTEKRHTALEFTRAILCTGQDKPCNECTSCNKINNQNHPDFIDVFPLENSIKISQLREMQRKMNIKAYESKYKVFIINNSETMGIPAQNSLLKSLEEPIHGVVVILLSKSSHSLLPTILSRGQILHFNPLDEYTFQSEMNKLYDIDGDMIEDLYNLSQGCIGKAKHMLNNPKEVEQFKEFRSIISTILRGEYYKIFQFSKWVKENNLANEDVVNYLLIIFKNILHKKLTGEINESDYLTYESIHGIIQEIIELQSVLKYNVNFQLQIERLLLKLQEEK